MHLKFGAAFLNDLFHVRKKAVGIVSRNSSCCFWSILECGSETPGHVTTNGLHRCTGSVSPGAAMQASRAEGGHLSRRVASGLLEDSVNVDDGLVRLPGVRDAHGAQAVLQQAGEHVHAGHVLPAPRRAAGVRARMRSSQHHLTHHRRCRCHAGGHAAVTQLPCLQR